MRVPTRFGSGSRLLIRPGVTSFRACASLLLAPESVSVHSSSNGLLAYIIGWFYSGGVNNAYTACGTTFGNS
jgi:hypothetical protein